MRKSTRIVVFIICAVAVLLGAAGSALFHGYFDPGLFEIKQVQWSPSKQVAIVAERSDQHAMSSYVYFVVIGDHVFSPSELRHAYHSDAVVFAAGSDCLALRWNGSNKLVVTCQGSPLDADHIDAQKRQSGRVAVSYENIPVK
jgi:hypothetical protein